MFSSAGCLSCRLCNASAKGLLQQSLSTYTRPHVLVIDEIGYLTRFIRELVTNDSQWSKLCCESR